MELQHFSIFILFAGMNIFVAFFLLLQILADSTPPASSSVPLIGAYFCLNMVLITLSSFLSVIIINLYHRTDKHNRVPDWLRKVGTHPENTKPPRNDCLMFAIRHGQLINIGSMSDVYI